MSGDPVVMVEYRCHGGCANGEFGSVPVPARAEHQDVRDWVELARALVYHYHTRDFPQCPSRTCDLKIPLPPDEPNSWIGKAPRIQ